MNSVIKTFKLIVHENLSLFILNCKRRNNILAAYASQKYTMNKYNNNNKFFIAQNIKNVYSSTEKSLMNYSIINFKVYLISMTIKECIEKGLIIFFDYFNTQTEIECRRYIHSYNSILKSKLNVTCNDLSNLQFIERNIEILLNKEIINNDNNNDNHNCQYRCVINHNRGFSIQIKYPFDQKEMFIEEINSFELLHYSQESPVFNDNHYFLVHSKENFILGLASFLDCNNVSIKTMYLNDNEGTVLYQRIVIDDYKNPQPFILEHEFENNNDDNNKSSLKRYFEISCLLSAKLPHHLINNGYSNVSSKPIHDNDEDNDKQCFSYSFFKLDGVLATLKFYSHHFVVTNNIKSESFPHSLPKHLTHRLKDFSFMVESELYESMFTAINKPKPMAIIDLHISSFLAIERMNILQKLKKIMAKPLQEYFIFFQGKEINDNNDIILYPNKSLTYLNSRLNEYIKKHFIAFVKSSSNDDNNNNNNNNNSNNNNILEHGKIYEVFIDKNFNIKNVLKPRYDKIYPNSRKCIKNIIHLL